MLRCIRSLCYLSWQKDTLAVLKKINNRDVCFLVTRCRASEPDQRESVSSTMLCHCFSTEEPTMMDEPLEKAVSVHRRLQFQADGVLPTRRNLIFSGG